MSVTHELPVSRTRIGQRGKMVIPVAIQNTVHVGEGTEVVIRSLGEGTFIVETLDAVKRRLRAAAPVGDGDSAAEAREDAAEEEAAENDTARHGAP
ncbi:bifunctional DNA-binding transcriptional regulator/antitoxin component of YhaV-PrlF toxin-antitoxin module [Kitasatospora sp. MAA4]|uniref:hypothetical protein n=1 Tax=Kitasatospora sp. MAA4 TaxID=3035093 RepID=UPI00247321CA|nr:hypothetical protein [Kitasatospora sp. MAA4]MDH6133912.1 bifunctional DNA-binding transcriptional regulator/antitoxin component of YhaV-PrlF toxin-antitoxin module [Kitasatospora sp. MAA4]